MRIISGKAGSVPLQVPRTLLRPTADRVREALFSSLGERTAGAAVLDLFAGSGSLGIEALSRGAASADFVESDPAACRAIEANLRKTRLEGGAVRRREALAFLRRCPPGRYDLVFADPPYARDETSAALLAALLAEAGLARSLAPGGLLALESLASAPLPPAPLWSTLQERRYGGTRVSLLAPAPAASDAAVR